MSKISQVYKLTIFWKSGKRSASVFNYTTKREAQKARNLAKKSAQVRKTTIVKRSI